jgi:hypothetical protein
MNFLKQLILILQRIKPPTPPVKTIDWDFLHMLEGFNNQGYVPVSKLGKPLGKSGVTIGYGFDLGQQTVKSLTALGLKAALTNKLVPYVTLKKQDALNFLNAKPLILTDTEVKELDKAVKLKYYDAIKKEFEDNSDLSFTHLDTEKQTVIFSVSYQYGSLKKSCPKFFKYVTRNMWVNAVAELRDFGDDYPIRRNLEADYLETGLKKGK